MQGIEGSPRQPAKANTEEEAEHICPNSFPYL